jgi:hypothetical protein
MASGDAFLAQFKDAAVYLRMTDAERLALASEQKENEGKKFCWVPKSEEAYVRGLLLEIKDGKAHIERICDGKKK